MYGVGAASPSPMISRTVFRAPSREMLNDESALPAAVFLLLPSRPPREQPQQDVLGAEVVVVEESRLFLREDDGTAGGIGEAIEHRTLPQFSP